MNSPRNILLPRNAAPVRCFEVGRESQTVYEMVGSSGAMRKVHDFIAKVAPTEATALIYGESGTGKELAVRAIHRNSHRRAAPLVAVNCAAIPENLFESELFGHVRGAFTGAESDRKGKLELAHGGTLFLDEVGELSLALQSKLLRVLQEREFERVGSTRSTRADVRVISATNCDLRAACEKGAFRKDLYFRLDVLSFTMPPLRERREDVPALAEHFLEIGAEQVGRRPPEISPEALACLMNHDWPGNVRELEHTMARAIVLGSEDLIGIQDLPEAVISKQGENGPEGSSFKAAVRHFKRQLIVDTFQKARGSLTEAARILHMHPCNLSRLIRTLDLRETVRKHSEVSIFRRRT